MWNMLLDLSSRQLLYWFDVSFLNNLNNIDFVSQPTSITIEKVYNCTPDITPTQLINLQNNVYKNLYDNENENNSNGCKPVNKKRAHNLFSVCNTDSNLKIQKIS